MDKVDVQTDEQTQRRTDGHDTYCDLK